jgi:hypothetical protein
VRGDTRIHQLGSNLLQLREPTHIIALHVLGLCNHVSDEDRSKPSDQGSFLCRAPGLWELEGPPRTTQERMNLWILAAPRIRLLSRRRGVVGRCCCCTSRMARALL